MHTSFFKNNETLFLDQWHHADSYTQQLFPWLPDLHAQLGTTFCVFNVAWPADSLIDEFPQNVDTYVFHFGTEYVDWRWLNLVCKQFPNSQIILISPYNTSLYTEPNLVLIPFDFWPTILKWYLKETTVPEVHLNKKTKKISSLGNRISQFRAYVCAYLHQTWCKEDYLISWRGRLGKSEDLYLLNLTGNPIIDPVIDYLKSTFFDLRISPDEKFTNTPLDNLFYDWSAYTDCVINCSNESVNNSFQKTAHGSHVVPGPYFTEKTWKCMLSGTALLSVGQYKSYECLSSQGFKFEYPWDCGFDQLPGDIDRISAILNCLDQIKDMPLEFLKSSTLESNQHNRDHILSGSYYKQQDLINLNNVQAFINGIK